MRLPTCLLLLTAAAPAAAQLQADSAAFVIRLGSDTTAVERYVRTPGRLVAEAVQRSPTTTIHRLVYDLTPAGRVARTEYSVTRPGAAEPFFTRTLLVRGDSAVAVNRQAGGEPREVRFAASGDGIPVFGPFYTPYEQLTLRLAAGRADSIAVQMLQPGGTVLVPARRVGRDTVRLTNQFGEPMRAQVDARGRLLRLHTPAFTTVERVAWLDLDSYVRDYAARDGAGRGLGMLSPRHAVRESVLGANLWLDYGRPRARGRPIWGALVPHGAVWRMGANDAAHLATDRPLRLGGILVEPGSYTLFLLPEPDAWTLVVNSRTAISGLEYDAAHDVGRVRVTPRAASPPLEQFTLDVVRTAGEPALRVGWGDLEAHVPITSP